jgi:hypothetical protein
MFMMLYTYQVHADYWVGWAHVLFRKQWQYEKSLPLLEVKP